MEAIKLSKREKHVLRTLSTRGYDGLCEFDVPAIDRLVSIGLVHAAFMEGHRLEAAALTTMGKQYLYDNPRLHNPVDWVKIGAVAALVAAAASVCALLIACRLIL